MRQPVGNRLAAPLCKSCQTSQPEGPPDEHSGQGAINVLTACVDMAHAGRASSGGTDGPFPLIAERAYGGRQAPA